MQKYKNTWSFSKSQAWKGCRKKYYFTYVKRYEDSSEAKKIAELLQYRSIHQIKGELIHQSIANYLLNKQCGTKYNLKASAESAAEKIRRSYLHEPCLEKLNCVPMPDDIIEIMSKNIRSCLNAFEQSFWPSLAPYKPAGVETSIYFDLEGWQVTGKIDYLAKSDDGMIIVDWKSGSQSQGDKTQALVYCLCVMHKTGLAAEKIRAEVNYLSDRRKGCIQPADNKIQELESKIIGESEKMFLLTDEPEGNPGSMCIFCQYYTICNDCTKFEKPAEYVFQDWQ